MIKDLEIWMLFPAGLLGGLVAFAIGLPMPFMLGAILGSASLVLWAENRAPVSAEQRKDMRPPKLLRECFVAMIGTMIGSSFTPDLLRAMPSFWPSILAILAFIAVAQIAGYAVMRRYGGYAPADALYASMPGGLIEAAILGEKAGADAKLISVQHFVRIIFVVFTVPMIFWIATGERVGSASGQALDAAAATAPDILGVLAVAALGLWIGKHVKLPASHMMGPMLLCAGLHVGGLIDLVAPLWLLSMAQWIVGVGLGAQFSGLTAGMLRQALRVGAVSVGVMLIISLAFALCLAPLVPAALPTLFLAFAPGGVTEMSLIALSLSFSPVIVAIHHLVRIICTVFITQLISARLLDTASS